MIHEKFRIHTLSQQHGRQIRTGFHGNLNGIKIAQSIKTCKYPYLQVESAPRPRFWRCPLRTCFERCAKFGCTWELDVIKKELGFPGVRDLPSNRATFCQSELNVKVRGRISRLFPLAISKCMAHYWYTMPALRGCESRWSDHRLYKLAGRFIGPHRSRQWSNSGCTVRKEHAPIRYHQHAAQVTMRRWNWYQWR